MSRNGYPHMVVDDYVDNRATTPSTHALVL